MADRSLYEFPQAELDAAYRECLMLSARKPDVDGCCDFIEFVLGVQPTKFHRRWLTAILGNPRVVIVAPPESAKTTIISIGLLAWWIGHNPWTSSLVCSAGDNLANEIADKVAEIIEHNVRYRAVFPGVEPNKAKGWSRDGYEVIARHVSSEIWQTRTATKKDPTLLAGGVGSAHVNGRRVTGLLIGDDLHDRSSKVSTKICKDTVDFVKDTFLSRATAEARVVIVQTRWNKRDVVAYVSGLKGAEGGTMFGIFVHPAIVNEESYWPEQWPVDRLEHKRIEIGEVEFRLVYLADEKAEEGTVLKTAWLREFPAVQIKREWIRYFGIDFARRIQHLTGGKTGDPDHFALAVIVDAQGFLVLEDGYDGLLTMGDAEEQFFTMAGHWNPRITGIETNGSGAEYIKNLRSRMMQLGLHHVIRPLNTTRNKGDRMTEMAPDFQFGAMLISDATSEFVQTFRNQWSRFPREKDDALDAVYNGWLTAHHRLPMARGDVKRRYLKPISRQIEAVYGV